MKIFLVSLFFLLGLFFTFFTLSGLFAWTAPTEQASSPQSLANLFSAKLIMFSSLSVICYAIGVALAINWRRKSLT